MESKYFYHSGICLKILKTTEFRKYCNQARLSFKWSSGLSNAYMDTTPGLYVLQAHKDRINKKTKFPAIKTIHWRSPLCRGMYSNEDKTTFDDLWYVSMLSRIFCWWNLFDWLIKTQFKEPLSRFEELFSPQEKPITVKWSILPFWQDKHHFFYLNIWSISYQTNLQR